eukprot:TRINITY_DN9154_c0_g3_i1.p1 TRINITY_DN9154_c0_g3~~TRINITY_DN9154_c0_g3_i1.p1  ORF type:complete len:360 (+),score=50.52 TRINITY_DN9154_c0_g3_i1:517-1596(+)
MLLRFLLWAAVAGLAAKKHQYRLPKLPEPLVTQHQYVFVVGQHHSGTTILALILCQHANVSCMQNTHQPENEGQHLQHVYPSARMIGQMHTYAFHPQAHLIETDPRFAQRNMSTYLYQHWGRFWNTTKAYLLEKSPRHVTMTRFLQRAFTAERSHFVFILRHPLGASHYHWADNRRRKAEAAKDCGRMHIKHWLQVHEYLEEDVPLLRNVVGLRFEDYLNRSKHLAQVMTDKVFASIGIKNGIQLEFKENHEQAFNDTHDVEHHHDHEMVTDTTSRTQRKLLEFHGSWSHVQVSYGGVWRWVDEWNTITNNMKTAACQAVIHDYELAMNQYGYSLKHLTELQLPKRLVDHFLELQIDMR